MIFEDENSTKKLILCIVDLEGYAIAPDRIYMKKKYTFTGTSDKRLGHIDINMVVIPKNFIKDFNFYFLVVDKTLRDDLHSKHLEMTVCNQNDEQPTTFLNVDLFSEHVLMHKHYVGNPHKNLVYKTLVNITQNGEFYTML